MLGFQYGDQTVQNTISLLKFQEHFYYTVFLRPGMNESLLIQDEHIVPKFSGFSAIIIALMLDIVPEALHSHMISVISNWRQLMLGEKRSTIEHFAFMILVVAIDVAVVDCCSSSVRLIHHVLRLSGRDLLPLLVKPTAHDGNLHIVHGGSRFVAGTTHSWISSPAG